MNTRGILPVAIVFVIGLAYLGFFVDYGINFADEGALLSQMSRLADGELPWVDFHIGYTPGVYFVHAAILRVFDHAILPGRWLLAIVISATMALLYVLTQWVAGRSWVAWLPPFAYLAAIPIHAGNFASSNIPYPVWYNVLLWVAGFCCIMRFVDGNRYIWLSAASVFAGLNFLFKPNVGLFHLAGLSLVCLCTIPLQDDGTWGWRRTLSRGLWWLWWLGVIGGLLLVFSGRAGPREVEIFLLPVGIAALLILWGSSVVPAGHDRPAILPCVLIVAAGFLAVNIPWLVWAHGLLGTQRFFERALFFGAGFEKFYFIAHPQVLPVFVGAFAATILAVLLPTRLQRSKVSPQGLLVALFAIGLGTLALAAYLRPMPQGFYRAIMSQFELRVFAVTVLAHWLGLWIWARSIGTTEAHRKPSLHLCVLCVGALFLYLQVYPRTDFMHWVTAAPMSAVLGACLIRRLADRWQRQDSGVPRWVVPAIFASPFLFVGLLRVGRTLDARIDFRGPFPRRAPEVRLASLRAPVRINVGRAGQYGELSALLSFVEHATGADESIFTFPSLDIISYLSGRKNPTRHGYFFPGWPGHEVEAEVIVALEKHPPRFVIVHHRQTLFFGRAFIYYYALDDFLEQHYRPYARFGSYVVLAHRELGPADDGPQFDYSALSVGLPGALDESIRTSLASKRVEVRLKAVRELEGFMMQDYYGPLLDTLSDSDQRVRDRTVRALQYARDPRVARALLSTAALGVLSPRETMMAIRVAAGTADSTTAPLALRLLNSPVSAVAQGAAGVLRGISNRGLNSSYWFGLPENIDESVAGTDLDDGMRQRLLNALVDPAAPAVERVFALSASDKLGLKGCSEEIRAIAAEGHLDLRLRAMLQLVRQGCAAELLSDALNFLAYEQLLNPRIAQQAVRASKSAGDRALSALIDTAGGMRRETALWIAATVGGPRVADSAAAALSAPEACYRLAAAWTLGRIGRAQHRFFLEQIARTDRDIDVREMAGWALEALEARKP